MVNTTSQSGNVNKNESVDCLECRLVGALGFTAIGLYLWSQAKKRQKIERFTMQLISLSSIGFAASRLLNPVIFLRKEKEAENRKL